MKNGVLADVHYNQKLKAIEGIKYGVFNGALAH